ncbi:MAG: NADAR family protein [Parasporobacterium sp.]|nr:NADAR family protein [Parasporobacterium sp.]
MVPDQLNVAGQEVDAYFFHLPEEPNGYLSNWYSSPFDLDGRHFTSVEQYIMYRKCMAFGDEVSAEAVLATDDPAKQKDIGRKAAGYIHPVWCGMRQMVVFRGLMAKFSQNEELKQKLLDTEDAFLVECAGSDKVWACGIRLKDDRRFDSANWDGTNILGFALMEVRECLKEKA